MKASDELCLPRILKHISVVKVIKLFFGGNLENLKKQKGPFNQQ